MKKKWFFPFLLLLLLLPISSLAAKQLPVMLTPADNTTGDTLNSVLLWQKSTKATYLFLPSGWDSTQLRIWSTDGKQLTVNGAVVSSGDLVTCFLPGANVTLKYGKSTCTVQVMQSANLPSVHITTESGSSTAIRKSRNNEETGKLLITAADGAVLYEYDLTQVKCRGNSSFSETSKKSYQIKLEKGQNLFGMGKSKTWVLVAGFRDRSLIRTRIALDMASYAGLEYTPQMILADAYLNGEYCGVFYFGEKVQVSSSRVDIDDLEKATEAVNDQPLDSYTAKSTKKTGSSQAKWYDIPNDPEDITGGYLLRLEALKDYQNRPSAYITKRNNQVQIISPKYASYNEMRYVADMMQSLENAIFAKDGVDPDTGKHYSEILDMHSSVYKYTLEECLMCKDANLNSQYYYKPSDSESTLLYAGPIWDFDASLGSSATKSKVTPMNPEAFWVSKNIHVNTWPYALYLHSDYQEQVREAWSTTYRSAMNILLGEERDPAGVLLSIDEYADTVRTAAAMDFIRWESLNYDKNNLACKKTGKTFESNITYLKSFVQKRRDWLDTQWGISAGQ